jgi:3-isopropylmalate dehydratase small subunit
LLNGLDDIGTTTQHASAVDAYEKAHTGNATMYEPVDVKHYSTPR